MIMTQKLITLAFVSAGLIAMAIPISSQADVMASAVVKMTKFVVKSGGTALDYNTDFSGIGFVGTADYDGSLAGASFGASAPTPAYPAPPYDFPAACVGSGCGALALGENTFPLLSSPPVGNYAAGDQLATGTPISNFPGFPAAAGQTVGAGSYVGLTSGSDPASANTNNNLSAIFKLKADKEVTFEFDVEGLLQAYVSSEEIAPAFASASYQMFFELTDENGDRVGDLIDPDLFVDNNIRVDSAAKNAPEFGLDEVKRINTTFSVNAGTLLANTEYTLSARIVTNADAQHAVPEPGVLALMGMGLLGMALGRRRKTA